MLTFNPRASINQFAGKAKIEKDTQEGVIYKAIEQSSLLGLVADVD